MRKTSLEFIDLIQNCDSIDDCHQSFQNFSFSQGYRHCLHNLVGDPVIEDRVEVNDVFTNIPSSWMEEYLTESLWRHDRALSHVHDHYTPFLFFQLRDELTDTKKVHTRFRDSIHDTNGFSIGLPTKLGQLKAAVTLTTPDNDRHFETHHQCNFSHVYLALMAMQKRCEDLIFQDIYTGSSEITDRELEVMKWISLGKTSGEIADIFYITERTANHHAGSVMHKMNCVTRTQAVAELILQGRIKL